MTQDLAKIRERLTAAGIDFESPNESIVRIIRADPTAEISWYNYGENFSVSHYWSGRDCIDVWRWALPLIDLAEGRTETK